MMDEHPEKRPHNDPGIDLSKAPLRLPLFNITTEKLIDLSYELAKEALGQMVLLQRGIEQQPHERDIRLVLVQGLQGEMVKNAEVVVRFHRLEHFFVARPRELVQAVMTLLSLEDRPVQFVLRRKMFEDCRFGHAGTPGDVLCRRAAETLLRKQVERRLQDLLAPLIARHASRVVTFEKIVDQI